MYVYMPIYMYIYMYNFVFMYESLGSAGSTTSGLQMVSSFTNWPLRRRASTAFSLLAKSDEGRQALAPMVSAPRPVQLDVHAPWFDARHILDQCLVDLVLPFCKNMF